MSRRRFLGGVSFLAAGTAAYARFVEPELLEIKRVAVPLGGGKRAPLKLLHLSDLHASTVVSLSYLDRSVTEGLKQRPDLICITGDFITNIFDDSAGYERILRRLSGAAPCFASLGNHDGGAWAKDHYGHEDIAWVSALLERGGVQLLQNRSHVFRGAGWTVNVVGLGDDWAGYFQPAAAFRDIAPADGTVVLSHNPDTKVPLAEHGWDLMLSGHTHGGQLRVPLVGAPFAPVKDKRFIAGLYRWNDRWLHITKGVGNVHGLRINCPPDISLLTLT